MLTPRRLLPPIAMAALVLGITAPAASAGSLPSGAASQLLSELQRAWQVTNGRGVTVAVLGSGVDPHATGLAGKVTVGPDYVKLPHPSLLDDTLIANGIAGNAQGAPSIAPGARILSVLVAPEHDDPGAAAWVPVHYTADVLGDGIRYAVSHGAGVIYVDVLPSFYDTAGLESAVRYALSMGVVITTPAFASSTSQAELTYPAAFPGVIAATMATLPPPAQPPASSAEVMAANDSVLVAAPDNTMTELGPGYTRPYTIWGSYTVAIWIAGTAALIRSAYPHLPPALVARAIALSASYHPAGGYNVSVGFGLINPYGALTEAGRLARLSGSAGSAGFPAAARFGPSQPAVIHAVHRSAARIAASAGTLAAGAVLLSEALWMARRRARSTTTGA